IRQPAAQSKLRELRQRARSACFVPVMQKMQNNRNFTLSPETFRINSLPPKSKKVANEYRLQPSRPPGRLRREGDSNP
ncbi:hypothetical protein, partial [Alistipes putredinis]|uniref:hypothetical protein n=1 Tax=Alistipes putredinis TaxID=28117 RepID=UPI003A8E4756